MKRTLLCLFCSAVLSGAHAQQPTADNYSSKMVRDYYGLSLHLVKSTTGFTPPVASRAFGYMGLALYESTVDGLPGMTSLSGKLYWYTLPAPLQQHGELHWPTVANNAMAAIMDSLFSNCSAQNRDSIYWLRDSYNLAFEGTLPGAVYAESRDHGNAIAAHVLAYSKTDGGHLCQFNNFPTSYVPPVGEGLWVQTGAQTALQPYWGLNRPFIMEDTLAGIIPDGPPAYSSDASSEFYAYAYQVYDTRLNLSAEDSTIAEYWGDGGGTVTPPGHSISMLGQVLRAENADMATAIRAYAQLGLALSDAFLACWRTKYIYNLLRPITYIRANIDSTWSPLLATPPFPEYVSGHSSQSGAFSAVMTDLFGDYYEFTDSTHGTNYGGPRHFLSFQEAAEEAMVSRLYGGIHYQFGNEDGFQLGHAVGSNMNALFSSLETSVAQNSSAPTLSVFPNPTADVLRVMGAPEGRSELVISDMAGREVLRTTATRADLSGLPSGIYGVELITDGEFWGRTKVMRL